MYCTLHPGKLTWKWKANHLKVYRNGDVSLSCFFPRVYIHLPRRWREFPSQPRCRCQHPGATTPSVAPLTAPQHDLPHLSWQPPVAISPRLRLSDGRWKDWWNFGGCEVKKWRLSSCDVEVVCLLAWWNIAFTYPRSLANPLLTHLHAPNPPSWPSSPQKLQGSIAQFMAFTSIQLHIQHSYTHAFHIQVLRGTNQPTSTGCWMVKRWWKGYGKKHSSANCPTIRFGILWHLRN